MTGVIQFSRFRIIAPIITVVLIAAGIAGTFLQGGVNLGIDFKAGMNIRAQVAPVAYQISYSGEGNVVLNIRNNILTVEITGTEAVENLIFPLEDYGTLDILAAELVKIPDMTVVTMADGRLPSTQLLTLNYPYELGLEYVALNHGLGIDESTIEIDEVRDALAGFGPIQIQVVGAAQSQEFQIRVEEKEGARDFDQEVSERIQLLLEGSFGSGTVLIRQIDYVGARFSQNLAQQTVYLSVLALALILVYVWFRFRLAYAVSAIIPLLHDSLAMFAFIGITRMEISTATIAALLTIIGYSLNDTIVIFDRVRENTGIMRNSAFREIVDSSISQSLSRTLMTSLTTLLAVLAIFIFGSGSIKDFALAVIFGVIVGTYSSVFVASPILLAWTNLSNKRRRAKDADKYGSTRTPADSRKVHDVSPVEESETVNPATTVSEIPLAERKLKGKRKKKG